MNGRAVAAGVLGGIAMFVWSSIAHMALPLAQTGIQEIPDDRVWLDALHTKLGNAPGFYLFPGTGLPPGASFQQRNAAMADYEKKLATEPSGLLIYHPPGNKGVTAKRLGVEFLSEVLQALLLAWVMAQALPARYLWRVGFAVVCGFMAAISTNISYWNWYGFPGSYTLTYMTTAVVGFAAAGLVAAKVLGPNVRKTSAI